VTRVAVVVPCFNDGATLPETLESLAGEEPHELVVVDDGSTE
jgi:glycosyltransferase involved in cell wall biosynthesis